MGGPPAAVSGVTVRQFPHESSIPPPVGPRGVRSGCLTAADTGWGERGHHGELALPSSGSAPREGT